ncbi:MAG TPA: hypothetical protein VFU46_11545 [Gemmatimonadales bacterium]|nr:hypothetical protein [Gemmatimonadales bacterium]
MLIGLAAAVYVAVFYRRQSPVAVSDFDAIWTAARALRAGQDPYAAIASPPWPWDLQYPLPAVLLALPFSLLPLAAARAVFMGSGAGLLAYALTRRAWWPLIALAGGQFFFALQSVQWTPLFTAAVLLPALRVLWVVKPTTGLSLFAAYPDRRTVVGGIVLLAAAFVVWPGWLHEWLHAVGRAPHGPAIFKPGGVLLLLALLRWRLPEGRQLAVLACLPTSPHLYEALPLVLVARSRRELLSLAVCGGVGITAGLLAPPSVGPDHGPIPWMIVFLSAYLPALAVVLRHRNVRVGAMEPFHPIPARAAASVPAAPADPVAAGEGT